MSYKTQRHRKRKGKKQTDGRYSWARNLGKKFANWANRKQKGSGYRKFTKRFWSFQKGGISWVTPGVVPKTRQLGYGKKSYGLAPRRSFHIHE